MPKKVDKAKLLELVKQGLKPTEIAHRLGCTERTVYKHLRDLNKEEVLIPDTITEPEPPKKEKKKEKPKEKKKEKKEKPKSERKEKKEKKEDRILELIIQL